jgi:ElaB/YqjD/DUF883 family membrane-anchored ribosome-binding protein
MTFPFWGLNPVGVLCHRAMFASMNTSDIKDQTEALAEQARGWKETAQEWQQAAAESARTAAQATDQYVRENVWSSIALAVLAGCALGFLLGRSKE